MTIGDLVDSNIMQVLPIETAKKIVSIMMGTDEKMDVEVIAQVESANELSQPTN